MRYSFICLLLAVLGPVFAQAQSTPRASIQAYLTEEADEAGWTASDLQNWQITSSNRNAKTGLQFVYTQQTHQGYPVVDAVANFVIDKKGKVHRSSNQWLPNLSAKVSSSSSSLDASAALLAALKELDIADRGDIHLLETTAEGVHRFAGSYFSQNTIELRLLYQRTKEDEVRLAWDMDIYALDGENWWSLRIDAQNGALLDQENWVNQCHFDHPSGGPLAAEAYPCANPLHTHSSPASYRVFDLPVESPSHGLRSLVSNVDDSLASPYGWHDTNGQAGAEFTITRGNNVYASEDINDDNIPGYSPDGGTGLTFDYSLNLNQAPVNNQDASITNLFYVNNLMHDIWYHYGFDEASGNFQTNNYGRGGIAGDEVDAQALDGGGTNNANFATPPDGNNPRMQMFIWTGGNAPVNLLTVNSPTTIAGSYSATDASFGPPIPTTPLTGDLVLAVDGVNPDPNDACENLTNAAAVSGNIAILYRGNCSFVNKVEEAQNAGAIAVIIVNNVPTAPITMGGASNNINIPAIMVSQADGADLIASLNGGNTVNVTIQDPGGGNADRDGSFDNVIIAHEYGHGISIRLTGGASNSGCLNNDEQMGEGWSDWFGLMLTIEPGDLGGDVRGIGTFAAGQATTGTGIRPAPYSTDFNINPFTYAATNNTASISMPHGVGFVWSTMLWDLTWALIDQYGYDPDLYEGTGGNNIAMQLVIDGIKLQACNPGFVDGRDAILLADQLNYNGANQCLIWEVFANRGLGFSASQGSTASRTDQVEAFDLPPLCQTPTAPPAAGFTADVTVSCNGLVNFSDTSSSTPQQWLWDFGDGNTSTDPNPSHTYTTEGTFNVQLIVTNSLGIDTVTQQAYITVDFPDVPVASADTSVCAGDVVTLSATGSNLEWTDEDGRVLHTGSPYTFTASSSNTFQVANVQRFPMQQVGPAGTSIGSGGYHGTTFTGTVEFTAEKPFILRSALVDAEYTGDRDIFLFDDNGQVVSQKTVNMPVGVNRIALDMEIPAAGDYSIGGTGVDLFRNEDGANYPYVIPGLVTLTGSPAGPDFYYYLYDWEVEPQPCASAPDTVVLSVQDVNFSFAANGIDVQFTDLSQNASQWTWDFGDGNTSTQQNPSHSYAGSGAYTVTLTVDNNCSISELVNVVATNTTTANTSNWRWTIMPNPTTGQSLLRFNQTLSSDLDVELWSIDGRLLHNWMLESGAQELSLDGAELPAGMYILRLRGADFTAQQKWLIRD